MPRKKAENGGEGNGGSEENSAKAYAEARQKQDENVIVGKEKTFEEQLKEARGEDEDKAKAMQEYTDGADKEAEKLLEEAFPERKAVNIRVEAQQKFNEKFGIDPNRPASQYRTVIAEGMEGKKLYKGRLTLQCVHGETYEKESFVTIEEMPRGEDYLWRVMRIACPHAIRDSFSIDPENVTDPLLRDRWT